MARLFKIASYWERIRFKGDWFAWRFYRFVTRKPKWRRVSHFDNGFRDAMRASAVSQSPRKTGIASIPKRKIVRSSNRTSPRPNSPTTHPTPPTAPVQQNGTSQHEAAASILLRSLCEHEFYMTLASCIHGYHVFEEHRQFALDLEAGMQELKEERRRLKTDLAQERASGHEDPHPSVQALLTAQAQNCEQLDEVKQEMRSIAKQLQAVRFIVDGWHNNFSAIVRERFEAHGLMKHLTFLLKEEEVRQELFGNLPASYPSSSGDETSESSETPAEILSHPVELERRDALQHRDAVEKALHDHFSGYQRAKYIHDKSLDPGLSSKKQESKKLQFDLQYLHQGMDKTTAVKEAQMRVTRALEEAKRAGLRPLSDQTFHFASDPSDGNLSHASAVPGVDTQEIDAWLDRMPAGGATRPWRPATPPSVQADLEDVDVFDSCSCAADEKTKERIALANPDTSPPAWARPKNSLSQML